MTRIRLSFYTNIPTPYQQDFFEALAVYFDLTVVYYAKTEEGREWELTTEKRSYQVCHLTDSFIAKQVQKRVKDYHFSWSIIQKIWNDKADYIILSGAYWIPNTLVALLVARSRRKTVAFLGERLVRSDSTVKNFLKQLSLLPIRWGCSRLLAGGKEAARTYQSYGVNIPSSILPYNIDVSRFDKKNLDSKKLEMLHEAFSIKDRLVFLSSGSLIQRKNMETLIRSVKNSSVSISLLIIGNGYKFYQLEQLIGNDERIRLVGFVQADELPYYYNLANVFVFASRYDGWGVVINEAIAAGLPIISSDKVGAAQEWVQDGINGFIYSPDDEKGFQQAIEKLVNCPDVRRKQALYNQNFRNQTSSAHYANYLYEIVKQDLKR